MIFIFDAWHFSTLMGAMWCLLFIVAKTKAPWQLTIPWLYFLGYSIGLGFLMVMTSLSVHDIVLELSAIKIFASLILIWLVARSTDLTMFLRIFFAVLLFDAFWQIFSGLDSTATIFVGYTLDSTVFALVLPLMWLDRYFKFTIPVFIATILLRHGVTGLTIAVVEGVLLTFYFYRQKWIRYLTAGIVSGIAAHEYFYPFRAHARWSVAWKEHMEYWWANANHWFGFGPGSFEFVSLLIKEHAEGPKYWLHGDWLQFVFETGYVGLAMAALAYLWVLWVLRKSIFHFASWVGLGIGMTVYSPLQFFMVQMIAAGLIKEAVLIWREQRFQRGLA